MDCERVVAKAGALETANAFCEVMGMSPEILLGKTGENSWRIRALFEGEFIYKEAQTAASACVEMAKELHRRGGW